MRNSSFFPQDFLPGQNYWQLGFKNKVESRMSIWNNFLSNKCQFQWYSFPPRCTISKKFREKKETETETILDRNILVEIKTVFSCQGTVAFQEHVAIQGMTARRRRHPLLWVPEHKKQVPAPVTWTLCSSSTLWALGAHGGPCRPISKVGVMCARFLSLTWSETWSISSPPSFGRNDVTHADFPFPIEW